jgi:hypothetical protein
MGLLDDAIREHLDLKRQRGADPAEIERAQREALGPVRRGPEAHEPGEGELDEQALPYDDEPAVAYDEQQAVLYEDEEELEWDDPFADEPHASDVNPREPEPPPASADHPTEHMRFEPDEPEGEFEQSAGAAPPAPHSAPAPPEDAAPPERPTGDRTGGETVEYDALGEEGAGKADDDVLEETPEFLQETPDHDRLWFEQRPPRDFDLDK